MPMKNTDFSQTKMGAAALARVEADKLTRRAALSKLGIRAGAAVFAAMNVDTIARMVGVELERQGKCGGIADRLAGEFKNAGMAFATGGSGGPGGPCTAPTFNCPGGAGHCPCTAVDVANYCSYHCSCAQNNPPTNGYNDCAKCCTDVYGSGGACNDPNGDVLGCQKLCASQYEPGCDAPP